MSVSIGVIRLRSALAITDQKLKASCDAYLSSLSPNGEIDFVKPNKEIMNIFFVQTGGSEIYFKDSYAEYSEPYIILARKENNSLAASLEIVAFLQGQGKKAILLFGEEKEMTDALLRYARFYQAKQTLSKMRLGVIGRPSDWLIASNVDPVALKKKWGITLVQVPYKRLLAEIAKGDIDDDPKIAALSKKTRRKEDLRFSLVIHQALRRIVEDYRLDGFTLRCFDLVKKYQQTACLGFGLLNDEGVLSGCEGDVPSLLTMAFVYALYGKPSFMANPSNIDIPGKTVTYAHCTCPLSMTKEYRLDTHFESDHGIGIAGVLKLEDVTAIKIKPDLSAIRALEGKINATPFHKNMCRTQINVKFNEDIIDMIRRPYGNHLIFAYGNLKQELEEFFEYLS